MQQRYEEADQPFVDGTATRPAGASVFGEGWVTRLDDLASVRAGSAELFADARVHWLLERPELGLQPGRTTVLDLGTLEGAHAHGLAEGGARVVGVEGMASAWVRALALNEMREGMRTGMRPKLVVGEATAYLERAAELGAGADLINASGLLYHLTDPFGFLATARKVSNLIFVWTHYFDEDWFTEHARDHLDRFGPPMSAPAPAGVDLPARQHGYLERAGGPSFSGGSETYSLWLEHQALKDALVAAGFPVLVEGFLNLEHPNGPSIGYLAHDPDGRPGDTDLLWDNPWHDADPAMPAQDFRVLAVRAAEEADPVPPSPVSLGDVDWPDMARQGVAAVRRRLRRA